MNLKRIYSAASPLILLACFSSTAWGQAKGTFKAPDDAPADPRSPGQIVASNGAGERDKILVLTPKSGSDQTFFVIVLTPGRAPDITQYTPGNTPPVTIPPGGKAYVRDESDPKADAPEGTSTVTPG